MINHYSDYATGWLWSGEEALCMYILRYAFGPLTLDRRSLIIKYPSHVEKCLRAFVETLGAVSTHE